MINTDKINKQKYKVPFAISKYMLYLILPKCNIVYGEVLSSVYLQIAININNQKTSHEWKQNKSWISIDSMARNTGYNIRIINKALKTLQYLNLITIEQQLKNKIMKFTLINHNFDSLMELENFNNRFDKILLKNMNKTKTAKYKVSFAVLEKSLNYFSKNLVKKIKFSNINLLRALLIEANSIYKGSSLFFLTNIAPTVFECKNVEGLLQNLSQEKRAIRLGVGQSTISRYIEKYKNSNYINIIEGKVNKPITLGLNPNFLNQNLEKVVINTMENKIICPICGKDFYENRSLGVHISKTKDSKHILLNYLKNQKKDTNVSDIYNKFKEDFMELDNIDMEHKENKVKPQSKKCDYLNIPCSCKMTCKECHKNWKLDYYNDCTHARKEAFIKEYDIKEDDKKLTKVASKNNTISLNKEDFDIIKPTKKQKVTTGNKSPDLVKYFYSQINGTSPNFGKECGQVKNLLKKYTPDEIRITMDYLKRRSNMDLRFLNNSIKDALAEQQYLKESEIEGTEPYLVKMYYEGMGQQLNIQTLVRDVQKIKETINSGKTYDQVKLTIQYMINIKCPTINFIGFKVNEALAKNSTTTSVKNNPSYFDRDNLVIIRGLLEKGDINFKNIDNEFKAEAMKIAIELFKENKFTKQFSHFEWAWRVGLNLDYEMYDIAKNTQSKGFTLDNMLQQPGLSDETKEKANRFKNSYEKWLQNQPMKFENTQTS